MSGGEAVLLLLLLVGAVAALQLALADATVSVAIPVAFLLGYLTTRTWGLLRAARRRRGLR